MQMEDGAAGVESFFECSNNEPCRSTDDERFDQIYPPRVRKLSWRHWTPVAVASEAAKLLVTKPGTRVLDIGCGPGKFCLIGALLTDGHFTGIEQRSHLAKAARQAALNQEIYNVEIIHGNVTSVSFSNYDAFYLFNPFEENMFERQKIDGAVALSATLYKKYTRYVAAELRAKPIGTRVATYAGCSHEVPTCYHCQLSGFAGRLKLWVKVREPVPDDERFDTLLYRTGRVPTNRFFSNANERRGSRAQRI
ncbi:MAG: class I SAM-dependent methyltransferase [Chthoniobacterales bacterium]